MLARRSLMISALEAATAARWPFCGTSGRISGISSLTEVCCTWISSVCTSSGALLLLLAALRASVTGTMRAWSPWASTLKPWVLMTERNSW